MTEVISLRLLTLLEELQALLGRLCLAESTVECKSQHRRIFPSRPFFQHGAHFKKHTDLSRYLGTA